MTTDRTTTSTIRESGLRILRRLEAAGLVEVISRGKAFQIRGLDLDLMIIDLRMLTPDDLDRSARMP